jgi:hypothetical protein
MTAPAHTRAVAEVLAAHNDFDYRGSWFECRCGVILHGVPSTAHAQHQADMLATAGLLAALATRPAPVVSAQWGVECQDDGDVSEAEDLEDADRIKAHHDRNCGAVHVVVRRTVTDWTEVRIERQEGER